ncbi:cob(I)yrinic acid a,c-diamide adenosyltransferase [Tumidithrix helvetica PCC 7403]|uniref:cob(I)yrinic acid a,c-diamide adenosyltransferase n=1 Tax=Tumidithrix helvetica TaxID=3457545 RepID=UPI003CA0CF57
MVAQIKTTQVNATKAVPTDRAQQNRKKEKQPPVTLTVTPPKGTIQVFIAPNRSLYADVIAQALRIAGQGTSVLVIQFFQGGINQGVANPRRLGENLEWLRCNVDRNIDDLERELTEAEIEAVIELWQYAKTAIQNGDYGLVVLDEIGLAIERSLFTETELLEALEKRSSQVDVMLTGASISAKILDSADQVTKRRS